MTTHALMPQPEVVFDATLAPHHVVIPDVRCDVVWVDEQLLLIGPMKFARPTRFPGQTIRMASLGPIKASAWLGLPLSQLSDRIVELSDVSARSTNALAEAFFRGTLKSVVGPMFQTLGCGWAPDARLPVAIDQLRRGGCVRTAARAAGLCERQLERIFQQQLGVAPRLFVGILRLRRAIALAKGGATLAEATAAAGFADQSHFNRCVRARTGRTPSTLLPHVGNVQDTCADRELASLREFSESIAGVSRPSGHYSGQTHRYESASDDRE